MAYRISTIGLLITLAVNSITAAPMLSNTDSSLDDDLQSAKLQREYAAPIPFPDHIVERKAQRSPSLRLRFGRSDPFFVDSMEKRWFGDVNQKPIRSPSLRLRFGKRGVMDSDYHSIYARQTRQPSLRLRWGRNAEMGDDVEDEYFLQRGDEEVPIGNESLGALLRALLELDDNEMSPRRFVRQTRNPKLRWGRSAGMKATPDQLRLHEPAREQSSSNTENESSSTTVVV